MVIAAAAAAAIASSLSLGSSHCQLCQADAFCCSTSHGGTNSWNKSPIDSCRPCDLSRRYRNPFFGSTQFQWSSVGRNLCLQKVSVAADYSDSVPDSSNYTSHRGYHPLEEVKLSKRTRETQLTSAAIARTTVEANTSALLVFPGSVHCEPHGQISWAEFQYIIDDYGDIFFEIFDDSNILQDRGASNPVIISKFKMKIWAFTVFSLLLSLLLGGSAEQCGSQAGGALCPGGLCCSQFGWCGSTNDYCGTGCQSQCGGAGGGDLSSIISSAKFDEMLKHRNDGGCPGRGFYTYNAFISAANAFSGFGTTGDADTRKREIAAFLGQTSHETTGGWQTAPDGPYAWGYCFVKEQNPGSYCSPSSTYPCAGGKQYYGRGPVQLSWNYNYGQCGKAIGVDLLNNPDLVATDPVISFKTAIWFWMTAQSPKPSCHSVITGKWSPSGADSAAGRVPGYGVLTNIINGGLECGMGWKQQVEDRIGFYKRYCDLLGVGYGNNLDCYNQKSFANGLLDLVDSM